MIVFPVTTDDWVQSPEIYFLSFSIAILLLSYNHKKVKAVQDHKII